MTEVHPGVNRVSTVYVAPLTALHKKGPKADSLEAIAGRTGVPLRSLTAVTSSPGVATNDGDD